MEGLWTLRTPIDSPWLGLRRRLSHVLLAAIALKIDDVDLHSSVISESLARVCRVLVDPLRHTEALPDALGLLLGFCCRCFFAAQAGREMEKVM
jgi:hypothetical protein